MFPQRIICLTEETTETLYLLGEGERVVGVSGYTVRPPEARQKPRVSSFLHAKYDRIEALEPDLILAFSDLQANITTELVKRGFAVFTFNQRSVEEILQMIRVLGGIVGVPDRADALVARLALGLDDIREAGGSWPVKPRVYFEEWDDPLISGIRWVEELVEIAGGETVFPETRQAKLAKGSHHLERAGDRRCARRHHRIMVRQAASSGEDRRAARMGPDSGSAQRPHLRGQVRLYSPAGSRGVDRRRAAAPPDPGHGCDT